MKKLLCVLVFAVFVQASYGQLTTTSSTAANLVQNVLLGAGITATNITYTGDPDAISSFTFAPGASLGFPNGVLMTTGNALTGTTEGPEGPNGFMDISTDHFGAGDADLATFSGEDIDDLNDAAVLEFDFIPQSDTIKFRYIFSSEEYNTYVGTSYNDVFAFILSGVSTPLTATNLAIVPGTSLPVAIGNINNGSGGFGPCTNCQYFRDNENGGIDVAYNGLTTTLTAIHHVICGETYHIKMVIADVADGTLDSGVFLEAGSFTSSSPFTLASSVNGTVGVTNAIEGCDNLQVSFVRPTAETGTTASFNIGVGGTATGGSDYAAIPTTINFPIGEDTVTFDFSPVLDGINEGPETIIITVNNVNVCGVVTSVDYNFTINDIMPVSAIASSETICPGGNADITATPTGGSGSYTYSWTNASGTVIGSTATINVSPANTEVFTVSVDDNCAGTAAATVQSTVTVVPTFTLTIPNQVDQYCTNQTTGNVIANVASSSPSPVPGFWSGIPGINNVGNGQATFAISSLPLGPTVLTYSAGIGSCTSSMDYTITVNQFSSSDFTLPSSKCVYDAAVTPVAQNTPGNWFLNNLSVASAVINPSAVGPGTYQVRYETGGTLCPSATTKNLVVNPKPEVVFNAPVTEGCLVGGNAFSFASQITSGNTNGTYLWLFGDGASGSALENPVHLYNGAGTFTVKLLYTDVNGCMDDTTALSYITVHPQPRPSFYVSDERPSVLEPVVDFVNTTPGTNTYVWSLFGTQISTENYLQYTFTELGIYPVTLTATTAFGCVDSVTQNIQLVNDQVFYIPTAFTPNNDGKNDVLVLKSSGVDTKEGVFKMQVFNRWGEKIFETNDYNENWNGTKNNSGGTIIEGTYIYKIVYTDLAGKQYSRYGHLNVFK
ncbi:MAG TPA: choice-of-anchor L domain-containing protein [Bacteroidia bacterium]